jgi:hypothetical protein
MFEGGIPMTGCREVVARIECGEQEPPVPGGAGT